MKIDTGTCWCDKNKKVGGMGVVLLNADASRGSIQEAALRKFPPISDNVLKT